MGDGQDLRLSGTFEPPESYPRRLEELRGEALTLTATLAQDIQESEVVTPSGKSDLAETLKWAQEALRDGDGDAALETLEQALKYGEVAANPALRGQLFDIEARLFSWTALRSTRVLPTPLGSALPQEFLARLEGDPGELRELLLTIFWGSETPEVNLLRTVKMVSENLRLWFGSTLLEQLRMDESSEHSRALKSLLVSWENALDALRDDALQGRLLMLLRWRLERCEDPLDLRETWCMSRFAHRADTLRACVGVLASLAHEHLPGGASTLSVGTWDTLVALIFSLRAQVDIGTWTRTPQYTQELLQDLEDFKGCAPALAQELMTLEGEGLGALPGEMREIFLAHLLEGHMEGILRELWRERGDQEVP